MNGSLWPVDEHNMMEMIPSVQNSDDAGDIPNIEPHRYYRQQIPKQMHLLIEWLFDPTNRTSLPIWPSLSRLRKFT